MTNIVAKPKMATHETMSQLRISGSILIIMITDGPNDGLSVRKRKPVEMIIMPTPTTTSCLGLGMISSYHKSSSCLPGSPARLLLK
eukprot:CAMPEP_0174739440 /NCGR_PEP_ID=MMETSP1094-20130205/71624_1 /TAXON_ID=156173 /ORGANISM="Chrysochromulina brevifilum, Strain UTEX LB 985" /LENGTH=85 /DNA_ID=CAMNT_0015943003 /DNA_START=18 /DNA_END=272 /DNA_ORIENTATION=+